MSNADEFLFNLNEFSHTGNNSTRSARAHDKSNSNNYSQQLPDTSTSSILAGLNAFTPEDGDMEATASNNFADQLALWTNANFSFDGPTGHALLLDDEKDDEAKREERERRDREDAARGGRLNATASQLRRGESSRDGAASNAAASASNSATPAMDRRRAENDVAPASNGNDAATFDFINANGLIPQTQSQTQPQPQQPQQQPFVAPFQQNGIPGQANGGGMSQELLQAIAFQQILSGGAPQGYPNALAMAGLFGAPNGAAIANPFGAGSSFMPPNMPGGNAAPFANDWVLNHNGSGGVTVSSSPNVEGAEAGDDRARSEDGSDSHNSNSNKKRRQGSKKEESLAARQKREEQEEIARELRDELPPLELIDTGNPEADAEANRVAIEEDKRRRNTAASARFRIKKKQREQALEQAAKELERRVRGLEEENNRLTTENGWLKSLITIRPSGQPGPAIGAFGPGQMGSIASFTGTGMQPMRDTGLQPRGVGTASSAADLSRSASQQQQQQQQAPLAVNGSSGVKRSREE